MRAMQCTQFCAKCSRNDLKPADFLKNNFHCETEEVMFMIVVVVVVVFDGGGLWGGVASLMGA